MTLAQALEQEHADIDAAFAAFKAGAAAGAPPPDALRRAVATLRRHIYVEEEMIFPPMRPGGAFAAIFVMLREHGQMWPLLGELDAALGRDEPGARALELLAELEPILAAHNDKEEKIIYSQVDAAFAGERAQQVLGFLATGTMPDDWLCERARGGAPTPPFAAAKK